MIRLIKKWIREYKRKRETRKYWEEKAKYYNRFF